MTLCMISKDNLLKFILDVAHTVSRLDVSIKRNLKKIMIHENRYLKIKKKSIDYIHFLPDCYLSRQIIIVTITIIFTTCE